jgi:hypothetical protein
MLIFIYILNKTYMINKKIKTKFFLYNDKNILKTKEQKIKQLMSETEKIQKVKCKVCKRKTRLEYFTCLCDPSAFFCMNHRFPFEHGCSFDHKKSYQEQLTELNPKLKRSKI